MLGFKKKKIQPASVFCLWPYEPAFWPIPETSPYAGTQPLFTPSAAMHVIRAMQFICSCDMINWLIVCESVIMGIGNILVLTEVTIFLLSFILSFMIFVPLGINRQEFDGNCLLYAKGHWNTSAKGGTPQLIDVDWGPDSACGFNVFMGVFLMLISLFYIVKDSIHLFSNTGR